MARLAKFILPLALVVILAVYLTNRGNRQVKIGFTACLNGCLAIGGGRLYGEPLEEGHGR